MNLTLILIALILATGFASHKTLLSLIRIYGISPSALARSRVQSTEYCTAGWCRRFIVPLPGKIIERNLVLNDIFHKSIMVLVPSIEDFNKFIVYIAPQGLSSIKPEEGSFKGLYSYLKNSNNSKTSGLLFYPSGIYSTRLFDKFILKTIIPENFRVYDFLNVINNANNIPMLLVEPKINLDHLHINGMEEMIRLAVYDDIIEEFYETVSAPYEKVLNDTTISYFNEFYLKLGENVNVNQEIFIRRNDNALDLLTEEVLKAPIQEEIRNSSIVKRRASIPLEDKVPEVPNAGVPSVIKSSKDGAPLVKGTFAAEDPKRDAKN